MQDLSHLALYLWIGFLGGMVGLQAKFPGSVIIGSMIAVILVRVWIQSSWSPHHHFNVAIQILLGVLVGTRYNPNFGKMFRKILFPVICSTLVLVIAGLLVAVVLVKINILDIHTPYLSTSPGAFSALLTLSLDSRADPSLSLIHI